MKRNRTVIAMRKVSKRGDRPPPALSKYAAKMGLGVPKEKPRVLTQHQPAFSAPYGRGED